MVIPLIFVLVKYLVFATQQQMSLPDFALAPLSTKLRTNSEMYAIC